MTEQSRDVPVGIEKSQGPAPVAWRPLDDLRREVDRLFDAFHRGGWRLPLGGFPSEPEVSALRGMMWPSAVAVDVAERDDAFEITAELPGVTAGDVEVTVAGRRLTLKAEKKEESESAAEGRRMSERRYGALSRSFDLPDDVDPERIQASHADGVLKIVLPRTAKPKAEARRIEVKAA